MHVNEYLSASALSNATQYRHFKRGAYAYEGYRIGFEMAGWCIFTQKVLWSKINKLDEKHIFWFSDNAYADQLKQKGIKHALICSVQVDHLESQTFKKQDRVTQRRFTHPFER
jgi:GT2 family glycosyltransferase